MKNFPIQRAKFGVLCRELALDIHPETITSHQPITMEKKIVILYSSLHYPNFCQILGNQISFRKFLTRRKVYEIAEATNYTIYT